MRRKSRNQQAEFIELPRFLGENNRLPDSELRSQDGVYVRQAVNVDLTERGTFERRDGYSKIIDGVRANSLFSDGDRCFYFDDSTLFEIKVSNTQTLEKVALRTGFRSDARLCYCSTPLGVYFSDGDDLYRIAGSRVIKISKNKPNPPQLNVVAGALKPGRYMFAVTWVDEYGEESPPSHYEMVEISEAAGIEVLSPVPDGYTLNVYASPVNASTMYLQQGTNFYANILSNSKQIGSSSEFTLPAGDLLAYSNGRLLSVKDKFLYYSEAFDLEKCDRASGYISFSEPISVVIGTENGIYVAADKTWFLEGRSITELTFKEVLPYGGVFGTACRGKDGEYCWMSPFGFVKANAMGEVQNVQVGKVGVVRASRGATTFIKKHGLEKFVTTLWTDPVDTSAILAEQENDVVKPNPFANNDWVQTETNRKESQP